ncbi:dethiobiotin synthase [Chitinophaga arvensicola]|uniref:ATP-dependent dethiobiotin synthetase BioD n=1 Tax=Chitinophaga arvensicola TaxID=29529 RepID=A0A1I0S5A2_9BACT|nr:dethiobiotin synthase [Chitinophaga arvensicola]SEW50213.1 dethiobiotin synthetase [Chitinophaga arvensicola]
MRRDADRLRIFAVMSERIFITGIGTGVGKTITAACVTEALCADYWKPVQTGLMEGTDTDTVLSLLSNGVSVCHPEAWRLEAPASPHLAARLEQTHIDTGRILQLADQYQPADRALVMEGAGGLMVPVNEEVFTLDLILALKARVLIVAQNYLGSINHAMLTARMLQHTGIPVIGWVFGGDYHTNEDDVVKWSGYPKAGRIPLTDKVDKAFIQQQAQLLTTSLHSLLA